MRDDRVFPGDPIGRHVSQPPGVFPGNRIGPRQFAKGSHPPVRPVSHLPQQDRDHRRAKGDNLPIRRMSEHLVQIGEVLRFPVPPLRKPAELGLPLQHRVEPLDGGDHDVGCGVDRVGLEPLDGVERRELARIIRGLEVGELILGLLAEVVTIDQKQNALYPAELEQSIGDVDGGEGLARTRRHLD